MARRCSSCDAVVEEGMRLCPNCGRLIASIGDRHEYQPEGGRKARPASAEMPRRSEGGQRKRPAASARDGQHRKSPARKDTRDSTKRPAAKKAKSAKKPVPKQDERELPVWTKVIKRVTLILVILAAVYFALFGLQVLRIKHSTYDFDTQMKLTASNYGEAFSNSVTDGSWSYNPFTFGMTYSGIHDGKEIEIKFSAAISLEVKSIRVGEEEKTAKEQINIYLMGLFI